MKERLKKAAFVVSSTMAATAVPVLAFAEGATASTVITTAATAVKTDALAALSAVAPIGISIGGAYLVFKLGWRFFKGLAK